MDADQETPVVPQHQDLRVGGFVHQSGQGLDQELDPRFVIAQFGNHRTKLRIAAEIGDDLVEFGIVRDEFDAADQDGAVVGLESGGVRVDRGADEVMDDFGQSVFAFQRRRHPQHVRCLDAQERFRKLARSDAVHFVHDGQSEIVKRAFGELAVIQRLQHPNHNVFALRIKYGSLDATNLGRGHEFLDAFDPLIEQKLLVHHNQCFFGQDRDDFDGHDGLASTTFENDNSSARCMQRILLYMGYITIYDHFLIIAQGFVKGAGDGLYRCLLGGRYWFLGISVPVDAIEPGHIDFLGIFAVDGKGRGVRVAFTRCWTKIPRARSALRI